jgi:chromate transporter
MAAPGAAVSPSVALQICFLFGTASLLAIGGGNSVVPEIELQSVAYRWLTEAQFADLFAIAQAAPGPSILIVTLVGYSAAWQRAASAPWRVAFERGLAPIAVGLVGASGIIVARGADHSLPQYALTAVATAIFCTTKLSPVVVVAAAGFIGWLGLV